jgi:hypothetical protein
MADCQLITIATFSRLNKWREGRGGADNDRLAGRPYREARNGDLFDFVRLDRVDSYCCGVWSPLLMP